MAGLPEPEFEEIATHFRVTVRMPHKAASAEKPKVEKALGDREDTALAFWTERGKKGASTQEIIHHLGVTPKTACGSQTAGGAGAGGCCGE